MALACCLALALPGLAADLSPLVQGWERPPASTKPWCYWYWTSDHISREGITRDLEAMARVGIGEAFIGNIQLDDVEPGPVRVLTEAWWGMVEHAIREAGRVGVDIGFFNCPGWSQSGGPWIRSDQAMRFLVNSEERIQGPARFEGIIAPPREPFQDVSLLAFPAPRLDDDTVATRSPRVTTTPASVGAARMFDGDLETAFLLPDGAAEGDSPFIIEVRLPGTFVARSLVLHPVTEAFAVQCELQVAGEDGHYRTIRSFRCDRSNPSVTVGPLPFAPLAISFPAVASRNFRLVLTQHEGGGGFAEVQLSGGAWLERFIEKQLGKMHPTPQPKWDAYLWPPSAEPGSAALVVAPNQVLDLASAVDTDGTLRWDVPKGDWIIVRMGMTPTGTQNAPASPEGQGLEVDKMNRAAAEAHFNAYVGKLLERIPPRDRTALKHLVADSYEMGSQNWTDGFGALFRQRYRYDPRPWFPTLTGRVVATADLSDRFLWDLRRLVADRVALDYVGGLRDLCHRHGLRLWLENYGHWGFPAEFLQYGGQADQLGGEFWATGDLGHIELRAAASAAHTYGMPVVSAEAFTGGPFFASTPWSLKRRGDWAVTEGINHFVLHVYIHQPDERRPGRNAWFGTEFNRHNTWFAAGRAWVDYWRRTHFLLQQGRPVADVAYFIGEDTPKMTGVRSPELPEGYDFDYLNAEVIEQRLQVKNRRFVLPDGTSYRLLILPPLDTMRPQLLRRIGDLVETGGAILGTPPQRSPSLENYPACDHQVRELASAIWRQCDGVTVKERRHGKGRVFRGVDVAVALARLETPPDVIGLGSTPVRWVHRTTEEAEIYFLSNQSEATVEVVPTFRLRDLAPELWHPDSAKRHRLAVFESVDDGVQVPLRFEPGEAFFVMFPNHKQRGPSVTRAGIEPSALAAPQRASQTSAPVRRERAGSRNGSTSEAEAERPFPPSRFERGKAGELIATLFANGVYRLRFSNGRTNELELRDLVAPQELRGPWEVRFPAGMDVPENVSFARLISWTEDPDDRLKHFSGTATYRCEFPRPEGPGDGLVLDLGRVEALAAVRLNGNDLGVLWKPPFRLELAGDALQATNLLEVEVTNTWLNRLLGAKRFPRGFPASQPPQFLPYLAADVSPPIGTRLMPSGLLGPVRLMTYRRLTIP